MHTTCVNSNDNASSNDSDHIFVIRENTCLKHRCPLSIGTRKLLPESARLAQRQNWNLLYEPPHDKTNKITVRPVKTQISLGIRPVWWESLLCAQWVAKDPSFLHADSEDSDQIGRMPRLIWVLAGRTGHFVSFVMRRLNYLFSISVTIQGCVCKKTYEPHHMNTVFVDFRPGMTQTGLLIYSH